MFIICYGGGIVVQNSILYEKLLAKIFITMHKFRFIGQKENSKCLLCVMEVAQLFEIQFYTKNY